MDAFAALLTHLGYTVSLHTAACGDHPQARKTWGNHVVAVVHFKDGTKRVADVGLGDGARMTFPPIDLKHHPDTPNINPASPATASPAPAPTPATPTTSPAAIASTSTSIAAAGSDGGANGGNHEGEWTEGGFTFRFTATPSAVAGGAAFAPALANQAKADTGATPVQVAAQEGDVDAAQPMLVYRWDNDASASFQGFDVSLASSAKSVAEFTDFHNHLWVDPASSFVSAGVIIHRKTPADEGVS